jgi:hypothetical protein
MPDVKDIVKSMIEKPFSKEDYESAMKTREKVQNNFREYL